ncbi:hypothetical protein D7Z94_06860 [Ulvibacterium marinum]|uniref:Uncharacterized protein n=1 Tax=Ulvibacterium marinum TaxID=2419782 RepID=A0A3B0CEJ4_9FLAO|nr:hypothetical protein D7Z94_06860 [Ulvibacterium marinum]
MKPLVTGKCCTSTVCFAESLFYRNNGPQEILKKRFSGRQGYEKYLSHYPYIKIALRQGYREKLVIQNFWSVLFVHLHKEGP